MTRESSPNAPAAPALSLVQKMLPASSPKAQPEVVDAGLDVESLRVIQDAAAAQVDAIRRDDALVRSDSLF